MPLRVECLALGLALVAYGGGPAGQSSAHAQGVAGEERYAAAGLASWYGEELAGSRTASGERFDPQGITAAHRSLPLGSLAEVTNLDTGRSIIVRVNDRGPHRADRLIDLSRGAAQLLGTDRRSVASVQVRSARPGTVPTPARPITPAIRTTPVPVRASASGRYAVQVGTFASGPCARALADRLSAAVLRKNTLYRVVLGPFDDPGAAQRARDAVVSHGYGDAMILPQD